MYLLFCIWYPKSFSFIEFLIGFCIYDDIIDMIQITDKKLSHFKFSTSGQILHVDKTCFSIFPGLVTLGGVVNLIKITTLNAHHLVNKNGFLSK